MMPDREKVMSWLDGLSQPDWREYHSDSEVQNIAQVALKLLKEQEKLLHKKQKDIDRLCAEISELKHQIHDGVLKEQEAVEPTWQQGKAYCGSCGKRIPLKIGARFCHKCGQAVKWE
jgi:hypothetical protein